MENLLKELDGEKFSQFSQSEKNNAIKYYKAFEKYFKRFIVADGRDYPIEDPGIALYLYDNVEVVLLVHSDDEGASLIYNGYIYELYGEMMREDYHEYETIEEAVDCVPHIFKRGYCRFKCEYDFDKCTDNDWICKKGLGLINW